MRKGRSVGARILWPGALKLSFAKKMREGQRELPGRCLSSTPGCDVSQTLAIELFDRLNIFGGDRERTGANSSVIHNPPKDRGEIRRILPDTNPQISRPTG
jgi:hypothetical protein